IAIVLSQFAPLVADGGYADQWTYAALENVAPAPVPFEKSRARTIDGAALAAYLAEKLGPLEANDGLVSDVVSFGGGRPAQPVRFGLSSEMFSPNVHALISPGHTEGAT